MKKGQNPKILQPPHFPHFGPPKSLNKKKKSVTISIWLANRFPKWYGMIP